MNELLLSFLQGSQWTLLFLESSVLLKSTVKMQESCAKRAPFLGNQKFFGSEPLQGSIVCVTECSGQFDKLGIGQVGLLLCFPTPAILGFCEKAKHDREGLTKSSAARKDRFSSENCRKPR